MRNEALILFLLLIGCFVRTAVTTRKTPKSKYHQQEMPDLEVFHKEEEVEYKLLPTGSTSKKRQHIHAEDEEDDEYVEADSSGESLHFSEAYDTRLEANVSRILDALIASHDRRIRPNYGGSPTEVNVTVHVITISAVSEVSMDYTVDLYLRQFWRDPRLAFRSPASNRDSPSTSLTVGIDMVKSIWVADSFFPNEKRSFFHETTTHNSFLRIDSHGNVIRSIRLTVTANCPMNLQTFPLDVQTCALEIESYGYSTSDIIYHWHDRNAVTIDENVHLAHFTVGSQYHVERTISLSTGNYSRLTAYFTFKRNIGFYLIQIYFPSSLIVVISWVSFFLNREATQARVTIGVTTVLTQTTLMTNANASLPKVSYVKSLDIFLGVCFFIVFAGLLEYAAVGYLMKRQRSANYRNSMGENKSGSTVFYYELDDQPIPTVRLETPPPAEIPPQQTLRPQPRAKRRISMRRNTSTNGMPEQTRPLLHPSPTHTAAFLTAETGTAATTTLSNNTNLLNSNNSINNNTQPSLASMGSRMSIFIPDVPPLLHHEEEISRNPWFIIRPSQVDLFSRIAFPLFFVLFHIAYWTVYLNLTS